MCLLANKNELKDAWPGVAVWVSFRSIAGWFTPIIETTLTSRSAKTLPLLSALNMQHFVDSALLLLVCPFLGAAVLEIVRVCPDGQDSFVCGTAPQQPCTNLVYAIETRSLQFNLDSDVVIELCSGLFDSSHCGGVFPRSLAVVGAPGASTTIDCRCQDRAFSCIGEPWNVTVANISIQHGFTNDDSAGGPSGGAFLVSRDLRGSHSQPSYVNIENVVIKSSNSFSSSSDLSAGGGGFAVWFAGPTGVAAESHVRIHNVTVQDSTSINLNSSIMYGGGFLVGSAADGLTMDRVFVSVDTIAVRNCVVVGGIFGKCHCLIYYRYT